MSSNHALVVGKFAPLHAGHQLLLDTALAESEKLTVMVWSNPDFKAMPNAVRAGWVRQLYPTATVLIGQNPPPNDASDDVQRAYVVAELARHDCHPDVVFTSEEYGPGFAAVLGVEHRFVDLARQQIPISGTAIRQDVHAYRNFLDPRVYAHFVELVVLMGAESTGKSTLTAALAAALKTTSVPEYGREYYEEHGGSLDLDDYVVIARRHRALEEAARLTASRYVVVDTNAITTMFFSHYYNRDSLPELQSLAADCATRYQHVFVCDDDIPFEQDGWRDSLEWRTRSQGFILYDLRLRGIDFTVVHGSVADRVSQIQQVLAARAGQVLQLQGQGPRQPALV